MSAQATANVVHFVAMVPPEQFTNVRAIVPRNARISWLQPAPAVSASIGSASLLILDPGCSAVDSYSEIVESAEAYGVPVAAWIVPKATPLESAMEIVRAGACDMLFHQHDSRRYLAHALSGNFPRRIPLMLVTALGEHLRQLPSAFGLNCLAVLCGATSPKTTEDFSLAGGASLSTGMRWMKGAGLPSLRRFLLAGRIIRVFGMLRRGIPSELAARREGFAGVRSARKAFKEMTGLPISAAVERRESEVVSLLAECVRFSTDTA